MILPTKYLPHDRALIGVDGFILKQLEEPRTVSSLWESVREMQNCQRHATPVSFDWFVLALNLLYSLFAIEYRDGVIYRKATQ